MHRREVEERSPGRSARSGSRKSVIRGCRVSLPRATRPHVTHPTTLRRRHPASPQAFIPPQSPRSPLAPPRARTAPRCHQLAHAKNTSAQGISARSTSGQCHKVAFQRHDYATRNAIMSPYSRIAQHIPHPHIRTTRPNPSPGRTLQPIPSFQFLLKQKPHQRSRPRQGQDVTPTCNSLEVTGPHRTHLPHRRRKSYDPEKWPPQAPQTTQILPGHPKKRATTTDAGPSRVVEAGPSCIPITRPAGPQGRTNQAARRRRQQSQRTNEGPRPMNSSQPGHPAKQPTTQSAGRLLATKVHQLTADRRLRPPHGVQADPLRADCVRHEEITVHHEPAQQQPSRRLSGNASATATPTGSGVSPGPSPGPPSSMSSRPCTSKRCTCRELRISDEDHALRADGNPARTAKISVAIPRLPDHKLRRIPRFRAEDLHATIHRVGHVRVSRVIQCQPGRHEEPARLRPRPPNVVPGTAARRPGPENMPRASVARSRSPATATADGRGGAASGPA